MWVVVKKKLTKIFWKRPFEVLKVYILNFEYFSRPMNPAEVGV